MDVFASDRAHGKWYMGTFASDKEISLKLRYRQKVGLGITDFGGAVIVSRVDPGSLSSEVLQQGDELAEIDGKRPSSKDEASQMIVNALVRKRKVSMKVSRANGESQLNSSAKKLPVSQFDFFIDYDMCFPE
ncbi:unnamed protein product [Toxocara canis]|uniref:PDZ domain-containing protein n=1 Tax=Toxocara canis TaxID=6265 RepID=A0A183UIR2_TOXCA|nr:unnamed protein product [Toxocara canis]